MSFVHFPNLSPTEEFLRPHFSQKFIPVHHSLVHTKGPHNQICKKLRKYSLQRPPSQGPSFLIPLQSDRSRAKVRGQRLLVAPYTTAARTSEKCRRGIGGLRPENSKVEGASGTTYQGIRCHPSLGLLEGQSQKSLACGRLPIGAAELGKA